MHMSVNERIAHTVSDSESLPYLTCGNARNISGLVGKPLVVWISEHEKGSRSHKSAKLVMVHRKTVHILLSENPHALLEP